MKIRSFLIALILVALISTTGSGNSIVKTSIRKQRFVPDEIHIKAGEPVTLQILNEDPAPVEFESTDLNKEKMVLPGKLLEIQLKGLKPGTYEFFSDFGPKELRGRIIVE